MAQGPAGPVLLKLFFDPVLLNIANTIQCFGMQNSQLISIYLISCRNVFNYKGVLESRS